MTSLLRLVVSVVLSGLNIKIIIAFGMIQKCCDKIVEYWRMTLYVALNFLVSTLYWTAIVIGFDWFFLVN